MLTLAMHPKASKMFSADKFAHVLDWLNLADDRIRLFTVNKNKNGYTELNRIQVFPELLATGYPLSRLWMNGFLSHK